MKVKVYEPKQLIMLSMDNEIVEIKEVDKNFCENVLGTPQTKEYGAGHWDWYHNILAFFHVYEYQMETDLLMKKWRKWVFQKEPDKKRRQEAYMIMEWFVSNYRIIYMGTA